MKFGNDVISGEQIVLRVHEWIHEFVVAHSSSTTTPKQHTPSRQAVRWSCPQTSAVKLNVDGQEQR